MNSRIVINDLSTFPFLDKLKPKSPSILKSLREVQPSNAFKEQRSQRILAYGDESTNHGRKGFGAAANRRPTGADANSEARPQYISWLSLPRFTALWPMMTVLHSQQVGQHFRQCTMLRVFSVDITFSGRENE